MPISSNVQDNLSVLVVSCDSYSDLWKPFFQLFRRFWPDCPFEVYLLSNKKRVEIEGVTNLLTGEDLSWSDSLKKGLEQLRQGYVLLFLEDLFLYSPVDNKKTLEIIEWAIASNVNYVRMNSMAKKADKPFNNFVGIISKGALYRASTVMSVWKKDVLLDLLEVGESAWDFEIEGTVRSDRYDKFYAAWKNSFEIINTVIRGKWLPRAVKKIKLAGIEIDLDSRRVMTLGESFFYHLKVVRCRVFSFFPVRSRRKIRSLLLSSGFTYKK